MTLNTNRIDGKQLAAELLQNLKKKVETLPKQPTLAVIQVGDDPGSTSYINQKKKKGEEVGIQVVHAHFQETITQEQLISEIASLNNNPDVNGIIVQRPVPSQISPNSLVTQISPEKDVDGFRPDSPFTPPVARGVLHILKSVHFIRNDQYSVLNTKKIVILGRGETAGRPIARTFEKLGISATVLHSKSNIDDPMRTLTVLRSADIIISCVGKGRVIKREDIKPGAILIGVGISRGFKGLQGDYDEEEIKDVVSFYTPTPGGVGPLTVTFLLKNTVETVSTPSF